MRKRKKQKTKTVYRNSDAERFLALAKFRKLQDDELREMDESFNREPDELDAAFERAVGKGGMYRDMTNALTEYARYFPGNTPSCFQVDLIEQTVTDLTIWREVLLYWAGNDYRPQSIKKMLDYYDDLVTKHGMRFQAINIKSSVGRPDESTAPITIADITCECGAEYCLQTHREAA